LPASARHGRALQCFIQAKGIQPNDATFLQVGGGVMPPLQHARGQRRAQARRFAMRPRLGPIFKQVCSPPSRPRAPQVAKLHAARDQVGAAIDTLGEALEHSPESVELLTELGLLLLHAGDSQRAFDQLGTSLLHEPRGTRAILAAASIIQARPGPARIGSPGSKSNEGNLPPPPQHAPLLEGSQERRCGPCDSGRPDRSRTALPGAARP
jgi:hypothetical protein